MSQKILNLCLKKSRILLTGLSLLLIACIDFLPKEIEFTQAQLQAWVQRKFPLEKSQSLLIAQVQARLDQPVLTLDAEYQKVRLVANIRIMVDTGATRTGSMGVSAGVAFDPIRHALVLRNPVIEELHVENVPPGILPLLGNAWLKEIGDIAVYVLSAEQIKRFGKALDNATIIILSDRIVLSRP